MLAITYFDTIDENQKNTCFINCKETIPWIVLESKVIEVTASENELEYIKNVYKNIPFVDIKNAHCKWRGKMAQFIVDNWEW